MDPESPTAPDSTTKDRLFCCGDEVLVQRKDGNFYLGTVVEVRVSRLLSNVQELTPKASFFIDWLYKPLITALFGTEPRPENILAG